MQKIYIFLLIILFASCSPRIDYLGTSSEPTSQVDVFVSEGSIKKNYDIIGKGYVQYRMMTKSTIEKIQRKAVEKARKKGADAVFIQDYYVPNTGTSITTIVKTDTTSKGTSTHSNTDIRSTGEPGFTIYFLKYTQK